ncbi:MAG: hypothetical protein KA507_01310 [Candidatus Accumulibacter sp.]|nr:hypothetical protein [Accumulibacter sp.]
MSLLKIVTATNPMTRACARATDLGRWFHTQLAQSELVVLGRVLGGAGSINA